MYTSSFTLMTSGRSTGYIDETSGELKSEKSSRIVYLSSSMRATDEFVIQKILASAAVVVEDNEEIKEMVVKKFIDESKDVSFKPSQPDGLLRAIIELRPQEIYVESAPLPLVRRPDVDEIRQNQQDDNGHDNRDDRSSLCSRSILT
jgi:hypothetical protein